MTKKEYTVIHHTVTAPGSGPRMTDYHLVLDYVDGQVKIYEHHPPSHVTKYAVGGANSSCYSVALVGNFSYESPPMPLFDALVQALAVKIRSGQAPAQILGHRDMGKKVSRPYSTACPGAAFYKMLPTLRKRVSVYL